MWKNTKNALENMEPRLVTMNSGHPNRELIRSVLPRGATLDIAQRRTGAFFGQSLPGGVMPQNQSGGGGSTAYSLTRPYDPEVEDPSRQFYPQDRMAANRYWRLFHKYDPIFGTAIDMYAEMVVSSFDLLMEDDPSKHVRDSMEYMVQTTNLIDRLRHIIREYLVIGEAFPHLFFNEDTNLWDYIAMHNPDYMDVRDTQIVNMDPIISFLPDQNLKALLSDGSPESREFRKRLPAEFVSKVLAGQKIRMNPVNCSFIPRKLHAYDVRGTSIASRMFRIFMVEDAVYACTIATFRRASSPLKICKLGDAQTGWIMNPAQEAKVLDMLKKAELDPHCFVPETFVSCSDGSLKMIGDLRVGDLLLDKEGNTCSVEVIKEEESSDLVELKIAGAGKITCTGNHKWPIWGAPRHYCRENRSPNRVKNLRNFEPRQIVEAKDIKSGDYLMIPRRFNEIKPEGVSLEKARLLGYYAAEGYTSVCKVKGGKPGHGFCLSFSLTEKDTKVKDCVEIIRNLCGEEPKLRCREEISSCEILALNSKFDDLAFWLVENAGVGSHTKKLSIDVMSWPLDLKYEFLKGYLAGDGCTISHNGNELHRCVSLCSVSFDLINQVKLIFAQLGTYASFQKKVNPKGSFAEGKSYYRLDIFGELAAQLSVDVWCKEAVSKSKSGSCWWKDDDYIYVLVRSAERKVLSSTTKVINMTVSGDHTYLAGCFGTKNSWIVYNYGINFESFGTNDRATTISKEQNVIDNVKFMALGLSKGFMTSEATYASSKSGLQVFLRRLLSLRQFIEAMWLYPKYFRPICEINDWVKTIPSEVTHRYRVKRTAQELKDQNLIMLPKIQWHNRLDPSIDTEVLNALNTLKGAFGYKVSKSTLDSFTGLDWRQEVKKSAQEFKDEQESIKNLLGPNLEEKYQEQNAPKPASPAGAPGSGAKPPAAAGKPPGPGSGTGSHPPGSSGGGGEAAPGNTLNTVPEAPNAGGVPQTIE